MKKIFLLFFVSITIYSQKLPKGFTYLKKIIPSIKQELRYCNHNNFVGIPIDGYQENVVIISTKAAYELKKVQQELKKKGLSLKIFDAYRPKSAVSHFVRWSKKINDTITKKFFYPKLNKRNLFKLGYISTKSGHSRGSSVDLTIVTNKGIELDMGSPYDFFGVISHTNYTNLSKKQKQNRQLLRKIMIKNNFKPYKNEWWHFTLKREPFPKIYFNFPVK